MHSVDLGHMLVNCKSSNFRGRGGCQPLALDGIQALLALLRNLQGAMPKFDYHIHTMC
jgi:hypothetical protein